MKIVLIIIHIAVSIALIGLILIQSSKGGLGTAFGGGGEFRSRRGAEKLIFRTTIITAFIFLVVSITNLLVR